MKALLAIAGCIFAVCLLMVVMDATLDTIVDIWQGAAICFNILALVIVTVFTPYVKDRVTVGAGFPQMDTLLRKWLRPLHLVTAILIWPHVVLVVLGSRYGLWLLLTLLLWHAWIEWAHKMVSK